MADEEQARVTGEETVEDSAKPAESEQDELLRLREDNARLVAESRELYREHDGRVDDLSEERATHQESEAPWMRPSSLHAPDPRDGMKQRWIRISVRGVDDPRNVNLRMREGWTPRPVESIPSEFQMMGVQETQTQGRLIVDDLMLCEMPEERWKARAAYYQKLTQDQMVAVENDLQDVQVAGHRITKTHTSTVSHPARPRVQGRQVEAAEDS